MNIQSHELDKICADFGMTLKEMCEDVEEKTGMPFSYQWIINQRHNEGQLSRSQSTIIRLWAKCRGLSKDMRELRKLRKDINERLNHG